MSMSRLFFIQTSSYLTLSVIFPLLYLLTAIHPQLRKAQNRDSGTALHERGEVGQDWYSRGTKTENTTGSPDVIQTGEFQHLHCLGWQQCCNVHKIRMFSCTKSKCINQRYDKTACAHLPYTLLLAR